MKLINNWQTTLILAASSAIGVTISQPSYSATLYHITDLGNLGSSERVGVSGINNLGQVAGSSTTGELRSDGIGRVSAFRTAPNSPINPSTDNLGVPSNPNIESVSYGINESGQVVGSYIGTGTFSSAFRTAPNSPINLETDNLLGNASVADAKAINNSGQVVVSQGLFRFGFRSYRTLPNSPVDVLRDDIGNLGGGNPNQFNTPSTNAFGINDSGQVVGYSFNINSETHAFRTAPNSRINPATDDLGTLGGTSSRAIAINNLGQVIGTSTISNGQERAFRTYPNSPINPVTDNLGTLGGTFSSANAINNLGQVVGNSTIANGQQRAFLFDEGKMFDLNDLIPANLGLTLFNANGINDRGQIVASGASDINRILLLTPITSTSIPEPSAALGLLSISALCAVAIKRRVE